MVVDNNRVMTSSNAKYFLLDYFFFSDFCIWLLTVFAEEFGSCCGAKGNS